MSLISVIIPAYNAELTIEETIAAVREQTVTNFELIIIDDGSTDRTVETVNKIEDSRIRLLSYQNEGLPTARNRGIENASGEYIAFLDADDLWTKDKLEKQLAMLETNPEAGVAYSQTCYIDEFANRSTTAIWFVLKAMC